MNHSLFYHGFFVLYPALSCDEHIRIRNKICLPAHFLECRRRGFIQDIINASCDKNTIRDNSPFAVRRLSLQYVLRARGENFEFSILILLMYLKTSSAVSL